MKGYKGARDVFPTLKNLVPMKKMLKCYKNSKIRNNSVHYRISVKASEGKALSFEVPARLVQELKHIFRRARFHI